MTSFVLIDESTTGAILHPQVGPALPAMAAALAVYANRDVASHWGGAHLVRVGDGTLLPGEVACAIVDVLPNAPGAIAYHAVDGSAVPVIFLALESCDGILSGANAVSTALAHEIAETIGDAAINLWADDGAGWEYARESCDAVESWMYAIGGVTVSDFVLPSFFAPNSSGPWNYLATTGGPGVYGPFATAPGGYQIRRTSGGGEVQVNGAIQASRLARKRHATSRTSRRGAKP